MTHNILWKIMSVNPHFFNDIHDILYDPKTESAFKKCSTTKFRQFD